MRTINATATSPTTTPCETTPAIPMNKKTALDLCNGVAMHAMYIGLFFSSAFLPISRYWASEPESEDPAQKFPFLLGSVFILSLFLETVLALAPACFKKTEWTFSACRSWKAWLYILPTCVSSLVGMYCTMYAVQDLGASAFSVVARLGIITIALLSRLIYKTQLSLEQYMSMVIVAGCVAGFANNHVVTKPRHDGKEMVGLVWISVVILLTSFTSLYYRKIPKHYRAEVNVFIAMQNGPMIVLAVVELFVNNTDRAAVLAGDFFMGWGDVRMWIMIFCAISKGWIRSFLLVEGAPATIVKLVTSSAIAGTVLLDYALFDFPFVLNSFIFVIIFFVSLVLYILGKPQKTPSPPPPTSGADTLSNNPEEVALTVKKRGKGEQ